ncbi:phytoene dehydrogenase [Aspergillus pseudotamarii]|uniref:Phytoene desaturase n=1 Tax=Aspergillus pseudotamarii TaxID=132259 RepID=A0A5N6T9I6_ASPPS|nr:phytoene dehydrogenase [Aspergillus pseudotamarii]KAE8142839.1 phytoene dehydrogenase [Aspergillus pseudotamarii]
MARPTAIVIGAGAGGIGVAARLAKNGFHVTVVEKNNSIGGRCSLLHHKDYRFDQGPSLLLMPELFEEIFEDLDTTLEKEYVELKKCNPNYRIWFPDQQTIDLSSDLTHMKHEVERFEGKQSFARFLDFLREAGHHYRLSVSLVLRSNFLSLWNMLRPNLLCSLCSLHPFESIHSRASRYFRSRQLQQAFTFGSMYLGMSPFDAPATYSLLQYAEIVDGIWYPIGGFQTVLESLARVGTRLGVQYRLNCPVSTIKLSEDQRTAEGVVLRSGEVINADVVIVNADLTYAYNHLLPPSKYAKSLKSRQTSCSSISFFWSLDTTIPALQNHNVFLAEEYRESFDAIFKELCMPAEPSFYVHVPNRLDPSASPEGKDAVVVLVPVGHLSGENGNITSSTKYWDSVVTKARSQVLEIIERRTGVSDLNQKIIHEMIETPLSWRSKYNLDRGAILGLSHSFFNVLSFRPRNRHADINGLYFVGASTHPGTGVPICLAGSKLLSNIVSVPLANDSHRKMYHREHK